jgi:hypothetical protein
MQIIAITRLIPCIELDNLVTPSVFWILLINQIRTELQDQDCIIHIHKESLNKNIIVHAYARKVYLCQDLNLI